MNKPVATYQICNLFGILIYEIDNYCDDIIRWQWSNESGELRESTVQYEEEGDSYFMAGTECKVYLKDCIETM